MCRGRGTRIAAGAVRPRNDRFLVFSCHSEPVRTLVWESVSLLESEAGKVCRPPPPRRLEMAIMLSPESMRHHGAWQQKITRPP